MKVLNVSLTCLEDSNGAGGVVFPLPNISANPMDPHLDKVVYRVYTTPKPTLHMTTA